MGSDRGGFGLFGKYPQKPDFVAHGLSAPIRAPLESWIVAGYHQSRTALGDDWKDRFLSAPILRFWIGARVMGAGCIGAMMPSVDQVGRYFPLILYYGWSDGAEIAPPVDDGHERWFADLEAALLATLRGDAPDEPAEITQALGPPAAIDADDWRSREIIRLTGDQSYWWIGNTAPQAANGLPDAGQMFLALLQDPAAAPEGERHDRATLHD